MRGGEVRGRRRPGPSGRLPLCGSPDLICSSCSPLCSGLQFQLLQAGGGVQGSVRGLQAPAGPAHRREPHLARRARPESGGRPDGEAAAAAWDGGPAGTHQTRGPDRSHDSTRTDFRLQVQFLLHLNALKGNKFALVSFCICLGSRSKIQRNVYVLKEPESRPTVPPPHRGRVVGVTAAAVRAE